MLHPVEPATEVYDAHRAVVCHRQLVYGRLVVRPLPAQSLADEITSYLTEREDSEPDAHVLTRCSGWTAGEHLPHTDTTLRNQLYRIARRASIDGVHPHGLRRTGATIAVHAGTPHALIQAHLGHSRIQTTERYIMAPDVGALGAFAAVLA